MKQFITILLGVGILSACAPHDSSTGVQAGDQSNEIIGGTLVDEKDPIAASTVAIVDLKAGAVICTGTLINNNMVMTAAHCTTENPRERAILFTTKLPTNSTEAARMQIRPVVAGKTPMAWPKRRMTQPANWGDIAILRFNGPVPAGFTPATLLGSAKDLRDGQEAILAGFGLTDGVKQTDTEGLRKISVTIGAAQASQTEIAFDQRKTGNGACHGDSGGPAFVQVNDKMVVAGVTSRGLGDPTDSCRGVTLYTNVGAYAEWINATVRVLNSAQRTEPMPQPARPSKQAGQ